MDALLLARLQFALTIGFHFIFPPLSIGLAWLLVIIEALGWKRNDESYVKLGNFFGKILGLIFAMGVATGVVMEFQFGTNWAEYSKFVGDIFGAPLAAEGIFAFFLESTFLGLYIFGRNRVSKGVHWFSILMVAVGATISAFWILVANSWQQTPAGYIIRNGRAELTDFWAAVFNPSTLPRFFHTFDASLISGAFLMIGISAYLILNGKETETAKKSMKLALIFGLIVSLLEVFPFGHEHGRQVARTQPEKFAAIQGLYTTQSGAPLAIFAVPVEHPPELKAPIEIPGLLSWLAFGDINAEIKGINEFPKDEIPPLFLTFVSYHNMVLLGMYFIFITALGTYFLWKKKLWDKKKLLKIYIWSIPLPVIACQLGWIAAEVGRQPWIVYKLLKTSEAASITVSAGEILFSIILFGIIYLLLFALFLFVLIRKIKHGPEPINPKEATI
ncbi:MAG: cytochrome ubiquinol oxidase subunit I [Melioribacter sp.]|uniref:cytochrome ubiquinol oxidase subunit I n=1 Tax=Rosettibacter primus TaxID=3111523 RepID=UPI00247DB23C|nr:cytochrome ubiquinol oxidase subunit I [Melioribacter sp.]